MSSLDNHDSHNQDLQNHDLQNHDPQSHDMDRWLEQLDTAISEVFETMLGVKCLPSASPYTGGEQFKVVLHVTGEVERTFCLFFDKSAAKAAVFAFTQEETADWEPQAADAIGEIGNMVIGTLKRKLVTSAMPSSLSVPTVSRIERKSVPAPLPGASRREREYEFLDNTLEIRLTFKPKADAA